VWKRFKFYAVSAVIVALAAVAVYYRFFPQRETVIRRVVDAPAVLQQVQQLNELVTVKYNIQKVIGLKEEKVPFGSESVLLMVQATVLGGVDLASLKPEDVSVTADDRVTIKLPPPKIMHVFVNEKDTRVWDREKTWWTPWVGFNPELEQKARLAALEAVQVAALQMGILSNAQQNAETTIRAFLHTVGIESVSLETVGTAH
jgi:Protein of unknown function (DUF4230)